MLRGRLLLSPSPSPHAEDLASDRLVFDILTAVLLLVCGVGGAYTALLMATRGRHGQVSKKQATNQPRKEN